MINLVIGPRDIKSSSIPEIIKEMIQVAYSRRSYVRFRIYGGVDITVSSTSNPRLILRDYLRAVSGYIDEVGPDPKYSLSDEEIASDEEIRQDNEEYWAGIIDLYRKFSAAPPISIIDEARWRSGVGNHEIYRSAFIFAEYLAKFIQMEMAEGRKLKDVVAECLGKADFFYPTGVYVNKYNCAEEIFDINDRNLIHSIAFHALFNCWEHGKELREWYDE